MDSLSVSYNQVPKPSALFLDYLYHFERVAPYFGASPSDFQNYTARAAEISLSPEKRSELAAILKKQNQSFGASELALANIARLARPETFAVVTGQQVGLLSGPAFTLYKALTAVHLAQWLSEQGLPSVPVFWLATEDHDLQEVARTATFDEEYNLIELGDSGKRPSARCPVGQVELSEEVVQALEQLETHLPPGEPRERLLEDLRACYQPGRRWGEAFGCFMARLFGRWGVVLLDPLDDAIHPLSVSVYEAALHKAAELRARLRERSEALVRAGYHAQVHVAKDSTLLFATHNGDRVAVTERGGEFVLDGTRKASLAEMQARARNQPLDLSPNVLLRPVVQDTLLPTVAYIAGPSELAYLGQAQVLYSAFGRPMPVVFPRAGFTLLDRRIPRILEKYNLSVHDVWQGEEHLTRRIAAAGLAEGWSERFDASERELAGILGRLRGDISALDPTLLDTLQNAEEKIKYQMGRLRGKVSRAALQRSELLARHAQSLLRFLAPHKNLQEREVTGVYFLGRAGYELLDRILSQIQTHSSDHQIFPY
jgi:bacillithiol biosynthesis cysteine-adding enzyme BshC